MERVEKRLAIRSDVATPLSLQTSKLDTSLKKHQSLLTKLKANLNSQSLPSLIKDIAGLSIEKYVDECVNALLEGILKCKSGGDILAAVQIIVVFHRRFPDQFTPPFVADLLVLLKPTPPAQLPADKEARDKEESARIARQRSLLRLLGECEAVGLLAHELSRRGKVGVTGDVTYSVLKELLTSDKESLALSAPVAVAFAKHLGWLFLPPVEGAGEADAAFPELGIDGSKEDFIAAEVKERSRKLTLAYLEALSKKAGKEHIELQKQDKRNHEAYIRSGEIFEDREKNYEKAVRSWEKNWGNVTQLAELMAVPAPPLPTLASTLPTSSIVDGTSSAIVDDSDSKDKRFIDEEERRFYEDLRDLKVQVPGSLLDESLASGNKAEIVPTEEPKKDVVAEDDPNVDPTEDPTPSGSVDAADVTEDKTPAGPAAQLTALLARAQEASSRDSMDAIAIEFAFLNSKAARRRLVKFLAGVRSNRLDILPYYGRLVATLNPHMPDVTKELIDVLESEFKYLLKKKDQLPRMTKNLRFFAELTKFGLTPFHIIFHQLKVLVDDFSGVALDSLCVLLENCGRFLLKGDATKDRMKDVLEIVKNKKRAVNLDQRYVTMLENAYYQCDPPDRPVVPPKEYTPMQLFLRYLFYNVLTRNTSDKVLKLVRKLDWSDPLVTRKLRNAFTKVWKIKYSNVHLFAVILYDLARYHPAFSVDVVDIVLENVRIGLEVNSFKVNQQRVATIKYLGELYNYRVIDSRVIFDTLWMLTTFGHDGRPYPDMISPVDGPDDFFRVRLICTLLDTCGECFDRGALKKKLNNFLIFFQLYIFSKSTKPMDVDFMVADTFERLRPKMLLYKTYDEASLAADEMLAAVATNDPEEPEDLETDERRRLSDEGESDKEDSADGSEDGTEMGNDDEQGLSDTESTRGRGMAMSLEEEDEFSRELAKMMITSDSRRPQAERNQLIDLSVPVQKRAVGGRGYMSRGTDGDGEDQEVEAAAPRGIQFTLLSKKGAKQKALSMEIPIDSAIAMHTLEKRAKDAAEHQQLKKLVLDYEMRSEQSEKQALHDHMANRGIKLNFGGSKKKDVGWQP